MWRRAIGPMALFVSVVGLYAASMTNDFIYDDIVLIVDQTAPQSVSEVFGVFGERHWYSLPYYRPVCRLTMVGQKFIHGNEPGAYHLFNAALMGIAALLAYTLLRWPAFAIRPLPALIAAALFAMHPIASCTVYPICSGRETLMPAVFMIAAVSAFLRPGWRWHVLALALFGVSLLCKEQAVIVPGLFALADVLGLSAGAPGRRVGGWVRRYAPVLLIALGYFLIRSQLFSGTGMSRLAIFDRPWGPLLSLLYTLQTMFVPFMELVYEPRAEVWTSVWRQLVGLVALVLLAVAACRRWSALRSTVLFWLGWFLLALLPTANLLVQEARFAERYGFLALLGVIGIIAALVSKAWDRPVARGWMTGVGISVLAACAATSFHRGMYFESNLAFLNQWLRTDPQSVQALSSLGEAFYKGDKLDEAVSYYRQALEIRPRSADRHYHLGKALRSQGKLDEAIGHLRQALQLKPRHAEAHNILGLALAAQGKRDDAISHYRQALHLKPDFAGAFSNLGNALFAQGKWDEAVSCHHQALEITPDSPVAHYNLGKTLMARSEIDGAIRHYETAVKLDPTYAYAHTNLGIALAARGEFDQAIEHYQAALQVKPALAQAHINFGKALEAKGAPAQAIERYQMALRIDSQNAAAHMSLGMAFQGRGETDKAIQHYIEVLKGAPTNVAALNNLGNAFLTKGEHVRAIEQFTEALRIRPDFAAARYNLARVFRAQGRIDEAIAEYREVLRVNPKHAKARQALNRALTEGGRSPEP